MGRSIGSEDMCHSNADYLDYYFAFMKDILEYRTIEYYRRRYEGRRTVIKETYNSYTTTIIERENKQPINK